MPKGYCSKCGGPLGAHTRKTPLEEELDSTRFYDAAEVLARFRLQGGEVDWWAVGEAYRPDQRRPDLTARWLFRSVKARAKVAAIVAKSMEEHGLTKETVFSLVEKAKALAEASALAAADGSSLDRQRAFDMLLAAAERVDEFVGAKPARVTEREERFSFGAEMLAAGENVRKRLSVQTSGRSVSERALPERTESEDAEYSLEEGDDE